MSLYNCWKDAREAWTTLRDQLYPAVVERNDSVKYVFICRYITLTLKKAILTKERRKNDI